MTGLLLLGVLGLWFAFSVFVALKLFRFCRSDKTRLLVLVVVLAVMLPLPVADELIAAPQFNKLCAEEAILKFDPEKIRDRTIFRADDKHVEMTIGPLRGYYIPGRYLDATTKAVVVTDASYHVKGGFFIHMLGISEKDAPLTMRSYCASPESPWQKTFLSRYNLKYIQPKDVK